MPAASVKNTSDIGTTVAVSAKPSSSGSAALWHTSECTSIGHNAAVTAGTWQAPRCISTHHLAERGGARPKRLRAHSAARAPPIVMEMRADVTTMQKWYQTISLRGAQRAAPLRSSARAQRATHTDRDGHELVVRRVNRHTVTVHVSAERAVSFAPAPRRPTAPPARQPAPPRPPLDQPTRPPKTWLTTSWVCEKDAHSASRAEVRPAAL